MTRLDAVRALLAKQPETADDEKVGHVYRWIDAAASVKLPQWVPQRFFPSRVPA